MHLKFTSNLSIVYLNVYSPNSMQVSFCYFTHKLIYLFHIMFVINSYIFHIIFVITSYFSYYVCHKLIYFHNMFVLLYIKFDMIKEFTLLLTGLWQNERKNVLFKNTLNTFYGYKENPLLLVMGYFFWVVTRDILYAPSHRQDSIHHRFVYQLWNEK